MADLPISFSGPMVRALLREIEQPGTGKTQTRRVFKNIEAVEDGEFHIFNAGGGHYGVVESDVPTIALDYVRIAVGDRLYVREHWRTVGWLDGIAPRDLPENVQLRFEADPVDINNLPIADGRFRQAMHMPKWASRITLIVSEVRVERLQDCSEADALAEGIENDHGGWTIYPDGKRHDWTPVDAYAELWDSLNGGRPGCAWADNPWIVAYSFKPILGNIDQTGEPSNA